MQSLYISNIKGVPNTETFDKYLKKEIITNSDFNCNFFYAKDKSLITSKGTSYLCLGALIYKKKFNKNALNLIVQDLESNKNLEDILISGEIAGQYTLIILNQQSLKIITDKLGMHGLYLYKKNNTFAVSNSILALGKNNQTTLNFTGIAQYLSENYKYLTYACCDQNIFNEITYFKPGSIYEFKNNELKINQYYNLKNNLDIGKNNNFNKVVDEATNILENNLSFLENDNLNIHSDLTGGVDTRVILALLKKKNIKFKTGLQLINQYEDFSNYGRYSEKKIIKQIEDLLKLDTNITDEVDYHTNKDLIDEITLYLSNKQTYNRRTSHFLNIKKGDFDLNLSGMCGTELMRLSYYGYFKKHEKLNLDIFLNEYVGLVDVLRDDIFDKKNYYSHLENFYSENLKDLDYNSAKDLSSYIDYFAFYRTHFTRYHGLANGIVPFYTPYGDFKFAKFMFETSWDLKKKFKIQRQILKNLNPKLASINCTRGFPLTTVNFTNFWRFKNMIKTDIPQQHFTLMQKLKDSAYYNFIKFSLQNKKIYNIFFKKMISNEQSEKKNIWGTPNDLSVINFSSNYLSSDAAIFSIIDKKKLEKYVINDCNYNILNRVLNLNNILEYCK